MIKFILLLSMVFFHIIDDYRLQGILASMKQKEWWEKNYPEKLYKYDYIPALTEHAFSWAFMIHIPVFIYSFLFGVNMPLICTIFYFLFTWIIHAIVDNAKANQKSINLCIDQTIHICQILMLWFVYII